MPVTEARYEVIAGLLSRRQDIHQLNYQHPADNARNQPLESCLGSINIPIKPRFEVYLTLGLKMYLSYHALIIGACVLFSSLVHAAHDTYVFFDIPNCQHYSTDNEPMDGELNYNSWVSKAKALQKRERAMSNGAWNAWSVFSMNGGERLGICRQTESNEQGVFELYCHKESYNNFPLAGASYKAFKNKKGSFVWFACVNGCSDGVPKTVYDAGYEPEITDPNIIALRNAYREFDRRCPHKNPELAKP